MLAGKMAVAVAIHAQSTGVNARQKTRSARRANRRLAISMGKGDGRIHEPVQYRRMDMRVAEPADGVEALLVRAIPKDIRALCVV